MTKRHFLILMELAFKSPPYTTVTTKVLQLFAVAHFDACVACEQSLMRCGKSKGEATRDEPDSHLQLPLLVPQRMRDCMLGASRMHGSRISLM